MAFTPEREKLVLIQNLDSGTITSSRNSIAKKKARPYRFKDSTGKWQLRTPRYRILTAAEAKKLGMQGILGEVIKLKRIILNERATAYITVSKGILANYLQSPQQFLLNAEGLLKLDSISNDEKAQIEDWEQIIRNGIENIEPAKIKLAELNEELRQTAIKWKDAYLKKQANAEREKLKAQKAIELEAEAEYQADRKRLLGKGKEVSNA